MMETPRARVVGSDSWRISLAEAFGNIEDKRGRKGRMHRLIDIFIMTIYGMLWGYTDFTNMTKELKYHEKYFTRLLGLKHGIPSHDTFSAVFQVVDPEDFLDRFKCWIREIVNTEGAHLAIDGKAIKAACDKIHGGRVPYIVNAAVDHLNLVVAQMKIDEKSNEIKAIPQMIELLDLEGTTVTIDAIGAQIEIAQQLEEKKANYVLPLKDNQPTMNRDVRDYFSEGGGGFEVSDYYREFDCSEHGRNETREYWCSNDVSCLSEKIEKGWPSIRCVGLVKRTRGCYSPVKFDKNTGLEITGEAKKGTYKVETVWNESVEYCAYIMNRQMSAQQMAKAVRGHWRLVENGLHYILDNSYREDWSVAKKGHATENLALMRRTVFNLTKLIPEISRETTKGREIYLKHHTREIEKLIFGIIPSISD